MAIQSITNVSSVGTVVNANNDYIKGLITRIKYDFIELGLALLKFKGEQQYLHYYDTFSDYIENELHFNKSTAYNLMNIAARFTVNGKLMSDFSNYSYSQLSCLLSVSEPDLKKFSSDMSVRQIQELKNNNINVSKRLEVLHNFKFRHIGMSCWLESDKLDNYLSINCWDDYIENLFNNIKSDVIDNDSEYVVIFKKL